MGDSQTTSESVDTVEQDNSSAVNLNLSRLPSIYILSAHLSINEQHRAEDILISAGASLTYDIKEASIVLGNITRARRAKCELQWQGISVEDIQVKTESHKTSSSSTDSEGSTRAKKRRKILRREESGSQTTSDTKSVDSDTASETQDDADSNSKPMSQLSLSRIPSSSTISSHDHNEADELNKPSIDPESFLGKVKVVRLGWLNDSLNARKILPLDSYVIYEAKLCPPELNTLPPKPQPKAIAGIIKKSDRERTPYQTTSDLARADPKLRIGSSNEANRFSEPLKADIAEERSSSSTHRRFKGSKAPRSRPSHLLRQTTSEYDEATDSALPPMPEWVLQNKIYACERATPLTSPNKDFVCQLKKIKTARLLTLDEIGVRAYSSAIAAIAAYPYRIQNNREVLSLPGCHQKIAHLFHEWKSTDGFIQVVADLEADPALTVLREFYEIWGVGAKTAREFYYDKGWRDLDDIVEFGWKSLSRVQQIGVKYYDEFLLKIPRSEVEAITGTIKHHAELVTDSNVEAIIVGGYRRGKPESGDVDVVLSHRDEAMTHNLVDRVVKSLEKEGWITHTLTLNLTNTKRNQEPLPINTATQVGHGFDTLDKALVVWQDPHWPSKDVELKANPKAKNLNLHRRVDIIISPWRTVGCAIAGWTSGTTFQRDLRRYAKYVKDWKFDSSGVRERGTGRWIDLEKWRDPQTRCQDWREAERRVFEGMGLIYREPWNRCTG